MNNLIYEENPGPVNERIMNNIENMVKLIIISKGKTVCAVLLEFTVMNPLQQNCMIV